MTEAINCKYNNPSRNTYTCKLFNINKPSHLESVHYLFALTHFFSLNKNKSLDTQQRAVHKSDEICTQTIEWDKALNYGLKVRISLLIEIIFHQIFLSSRKFLLPPLLSNPTEYS